MSSITANVYRSDDSRIIRVSLELDYAKGDHSLISFKCGENKIAVISTSKGNIDSEGNVKTDARSIEMHLEYANSSNKLECLVGYYDERDLKYYETLTSTFDNSIGIVETPVSVPSLKTIPASYKARFQDFFAALDRRVSSWQVEMSYPEDVVLQIVKSGKDPMTVCFGEQSREVLSSDYIFQLDPEVNKVSLPREIVKNRYHKYSSNCSLGLFELIKPDFLGVQNVFYKSPISNLLNISEFRKANEL